MYQLLPIALFFFITLSTYTQSSITSLLKDNTLVTELNENGYIWHQTRTETTRTLLLNNNFIAAQLENNLIETHANYATEFIYLEPKGLLQTRPSDLETYNRLLDLKQLERTNVKKNNGKTVPLFSPIHLYRDETFKNRIKMLDAVSTIPTEASYYAAMRDERLGLLKYRVNFHYDQGTFSFRLTNLEKGKVILWNLLDKEALSINYIVQPVTTGYLHIIQIAGNLQNFHKIDGAMDINSFFSRRVEAFKSWYFTHALNFPIEYAILPMAIKPLDE